MKIIANGETRQVTDGLSVAGFLRECGWKPTQVVVEKNGNVLLRSDLNSQILQDNDRLEIVVPVAGG